MAKPRVFVSSTYFDLKVVRADLERFIREVGYEPILFERGDIPYGRKNALEEYCYREITTCDILVAIVGGKYGTQSKDEIHSITQKELKTAVELDKQVYVFVERSVHAEMATYRINKDLKGFKPSSVNDVRIFQLLEEVYALPFGNPIEPFEISEDIIRYLKTQWAGLFQRLLQESTRQREISIIENLEATASTLNQLVTFLTEERKGEDSVIKDILLSTHPAFASIKKVTQIPYRVVFYTFDELNTLLTARLFAFDENPFDEERSYYEWNHAKLGYGIRVAMSIFDDSGKLKVITPQEWDDSWIEKVVVQDDAFSDDNIPF